MISWQNEPHLIINETVISYDIWYSAILNPLASVEFKSSQTLQKPSLNHEFTQKVIKVTAISLNTL